MAELSVAVKKGTFVKTTASAHACRPAVKRHAATTVAVARVGRAMRTRRVSRGPASALLSAQVFPAAMVAVVEPAVTAMRTRSAPRDNVSAFPIAPSRTEVTVAAANAPDVNLMTPTGVSPIRDANAFNAMMEAISGQRTSSR